jgi:hypothetical protein
VGHLLEWLGPGQAAATSAACRPGATFPTWRTSAIRSAEVQADGVARITKAPGSGGRVNFDTVRQQLLYEVHDPHAYLSPDVVLDMSTLRLEDMGEDRVHLSGATGRARPEALKVVAGFTTATRRGDLGIQLAGCLREGTGGGRDREDPARREAGRARGAVRRIPRAQLGARCTRPAARAHGRAQRGVGAHGDAHAREIRRGWFRQAVPVDGAERAGYTCGFHGLHHTGELLGIWPTLIERERVEPQIRIEINEA